MKTNGMLDCPEIQDTLFGEPQVLADETDVDPDAECPCICSCRTQSVKISNGELLSAALWFGKMPLE